ncbi:hypothetical protein PV328_006875 [Microctonus aethiopoides]|uniref:threonine--tRNA ligase n=1 Tax=Microctonus aethiopoides TaxID=144406 RepID=A0AA39FQ16_9HYME|nr:hypothetical protein PV328_006875 [Microctonus aethiopoides]
MNNVIMLTLLRFRPSLNSCNVRWTHARIKIKGNKDKSSLQKSISELNPWPSFIQDRINLWDKLKAQYDAKVAAKPVTDLIICLPDGKQISGQSWRTTPYEIAKGISPSLADNAIVAKVNNVLWDLERPLESDCELELLKFDHPEGQQVFWHSSAHILGEVMERVYGGCLCYGPPTENGFYYDMFLGDKAVSHFDIPYMETLYRSIVKEKQKFERLELKKEDLMEMFKYNEFKMRMLRDKIDTPTATVYRCGPLIDLCHGPHVRHTGKIKAIKITNTSSTFWDGNSNAESLQRVYGISFPQTKQLVEWETLQAEAAKRDHRKIGRDQELFFFHEFSPGSCFFQPRGAHIYNTLIELIRTEYKKRGYQEVITPNIFNSKLWQTSGHWEHYADNMYTFIDEKQTFALKPMNCPGHCMIFNVRNRSWRELPLRMADFGVLHRNELSGTLTGLTRVRRFQQDDAHIFCTIDQIKDEVFSCLEFLKCIYTILGFTFDLCLSTRPEKYLGDIDVWDNAEKALADSLNAFGAPWTINAQDGAFYGPKIDITITDAMKRSHQCATIQLDFQLPIRFDLSFINEHGQKMRPVIIHRAILGSVERMIAILTESYGGKWPFWLSPRQVMVIPVDPIFEEYAAQVKEKLWHAGFMTEVDIDNSNTMNKKVRNAQLAQFNFILIVGEKERNGESVNVRTRDGVVHGEIKIDEFIAKLMNFKKTKEINCEKMF